MHGDQVALEAEVADPESADVLAALVSHAFPEPEFKRVIEVSVAARAGPSDEEIMALEGLISDTVIYFESSSTEVGPSAKEELELLAAALGKVPGASIALIGHADQYGNAAFNKKLSLKRCEAVRSVLEGFGVDYLLMEIDGRRLLVEVRRRSEGRNAKCEGECGYRNARGHRASGDACARRRIPAAPAGRQSEPSAAERDGGKPAGQRVTGQRESE